MSQNIRSLVLALAVVGLGSVGYAADETDSASDSASLHTYAKDGESFFALSLKPPVARPAASPHDVVILFDTSASQTGAFRARALAALEEALAALPAGDRVRLFAVDLNSIPLTESFVAPGGRELAAAMAALRERVPLGSTDMQAALAAACDSFAAPGGEAGRARSALYIGDGMSTANLLAPGALRETVDRLVDSRVPVTSYAVGPRLDTELLAVLANQSGGLLAIDGENMTTAQMGNWLAASATAPVAWSKSLRLPEGMTSIGGARGLPLRFDRDTIVLGTGAPAAAGEAQMTADIAGREGALTWTVAPTASNPEYSFLSQVVKAGQRDEGLTLPTLGSVGLAETRRILSEQAENLNRLGRLALATGDVRQAARLADAAAKIDESDPEAAAIARVAERGTLKLAAHQVDAPAPGNAGAADEPPASPLDRDGGLIDEVERLRRVAAQSMQTEVRAELAAARATIATDPEPVQQRLKLLLERVRKASELDAGTRAQLTGQIETMLQEAQRKVDEFQFRDVRRQEVQAEMDARRQMNRELYLTQVKTEQLMRRYNGLLLEHRFRDAEEAATQARELHQDSLSQDAIAPHAGTLAARTMGYTYDMRVLRERRHKGVVEMLYAAEVAHVPQSDEPPIVYPSAERWMELTERRAHWAEAVSLYSPGSAEEKIIKALKEPIELEFDNLSLTDVVEFIKAKAGVEIQLDNKALAEAAVDPSLPVTRSVKGVSLRSALKLILDEFELTYVIEDEVLKITTKERADEIITTRVYPVADLVVPIMSSPVGGGGMGGIGGMGMMGGMGGMGMGGMGMGGMGMGGMGMGGGMGGMGMGGGMGMFNVPDQLPPARHGLRAFAVKDDLKLAPAAPAPRTATTQQPATGAKPAARPAAVPAAKPAKVQAIVLPEGADSRAAWNDYFATHQEAPEVVRETVRQLGAKKQFGQVADCIQAALAHGQGQDWMYEALGLALQIDGRPLADVERALMSAVDFVESTDHLAYLADYMAGIGLEKRALELFRQIAALEPTDPHPYVRGLGLARKLDDLAAIQWATVGILGLAWDDREAVVWQEAYNVAATTLERLRTEDRKSEADAYEQKLNQALVRDCVVVVSWAGDADVDLVIEEPSGTICSLRNPRTPSGGVLLGDHRKPAAGAGNMISESYVCPAGFDGTYRVLVRRVWGKLPTGKVNVDVYTHYLSDQQTRVSKQIPLENDEALVTFELKNGRRAEPLADRQLANAVAKQVNVGRQILAQQLAATADPAALASFLNSRGAGVANGAAPFQPFFLQGAVGYQPVIQTLPEGANLAVSSAVISHDRRYVRISPFPFFSGIGEVNTFNFVSGQSGTSQGGGGGGGFGGGGFGGGGFGGGGFGGGGFGGF